MTMLPDMHNFAVHTNKPKPRSTILKPFRHNGTCAQGDLVPFYRDAVIPGSTFDIRTSFDLKMLRTPFTAVMDDAYIDAYYFFVPSRILYSKWAQIFGVDQPSAWTSTTDVALPTITLSNFQNGAVAHDSAFNALRLPIGFSGKIENPLMFLAYLKICDAWFRDENVENSSPFIETYFSAASGTDVTPSGTDWAFQMTGSFYRVNKYHDYFTSVLPAPQKNGAPVSLPLGTSAPVHAQSSGQIRWFNNSAGLASAGENVEMLVSLSGGASSTDVVGVPASGTNPSRPLNALLNDTVLTNAGVYADLSNATAADINDLRLALAMQVYFEALARGGSRYNEYLKAFFGVCPLDATLQRPEFLGGFHKRLNMQQVAQTGSKGSIGVATTDTTGALGAYSNTSGSENTFVKSFTEYGYVIGVFCIRVKHRYSQGVDREWRKSTRWDFYNPVFDRLGEVPVAKDEIKAGATGNLGFIPAWSEHRMSVDWISGSITPGVATDLTAYTYGDYYTSAPTLSRAWLAEPTANIEQTLTGTWTVPQFVFDFSVENKATQPISVDSAPNTLGF